MAKFAYSAVTTDGQTVKGVQDAITVTQARMALVQRNLDPLEVNEKRGILSFELTKKKLKRKELMHFSRQLAVFIRAGIPLVDGLETISEDTGSKVLKVVLT